MNIKNIKKSISLNTYRNKHYHSLNAFKQEFVWIMREAIGRENKPLKTPVKIIFTFHHKTKRDLRDIDGEIPTAKFAIDSLVELGLLPDDKPCYVPEIVLRTGEKKDNCFDIEIISI